MSSTRGTIFAGLVFTGASPDFKNNHRRRTLSTMRLGTYVATSFVVAVLAFGVAERSWSTEATPKSTPVETDKGVSQELDSFDRWRHSLSEEREILERQADRQYSAFEKLTDKAIWVFGVILAAAIGLFAWFFGKSRQDFQRTIQESLERQAQEIVEREADRLRQSYASLRTEVDDLSSYKRRQVAWVLKPDSPSPDPVLKALYALGLQNITLVTPEPGHGFELGEPDLVILTFDGSEEARRILSELVGRLKQESPPVPLLIYTFSAGIERVQLTRSEFEILDGFDWYVPVGFPAQLLAQTQLLIRRSRSVLGGDVG